VPAWARATAFDAAATINIGIVSPLTGPASGFGEPDPYVVGLARAAFAKGLKIGGKTYAVKVIEKDSQSGPVSGLTMPMLIVAAASNAVARAHAGTVPAAPPIATPPMAAPLRLRNSPRLTPPDPCVASSDMRSPLSLAVMRPLRRRAGMLNRPHG